MYPDIEAYYADLVAIYRAEVEDLAALGGTVLQLDDTALPCNCDETVRAEVRARGEARTRSRAATSASSTTSSPRAGRHGAVDSHCRGN